MKFTTGKTAVAVAAALIMSAPFAAGALSITDISGQVEALLKQIATLQEQIKRLQNVAIEEREDGIWIPKHRICALLNRNLNVGVSGEDVTGLQEFLKELGFFSGNVTGYFGPLTSQAVAKWQSSEGVTAVGAFGPMSRERLKIWCGGGGWTNKEKFSASPQRGEAPLTVTFSSYVSGFRPQSDYYTIEFGDGTSERASHCPAPADACTGPGTNTHTYTQNGSYTATLVHTSDPCNGNPMCMAPVSREVVGKVQIQVGPVACTKEYMPVCGSKPITCITTPCNPIPTTYSNKCMMEADGASYLYQGQCRSSTTNPADDPQCKSWYDGCNTCTRNSPGGMAVCTLMYCSNPAPAYCKAYFEDAANKPPVVSGISGPTTLAVNAVGTWTVNASDPENGTLSYNIRWGDETGYAYPTNADAVGGYAVTQQSTFTHSYANAGTYTIVVVVTDNAGKQAKTSTTVKVGNDPVACTMEFNPVCGRPPGCANTCPPGMYCAAICQLHLPKTYGNRCMLNAEGATKLHEGPCTPTSGNIY